MAARIRNVMESCLEMAAISITRADLVACPWPGPGAGDRMPHRLQAPGMMNSQSLFTSHRSPRFTRIWTKGNSACPAFGRNRP